MRTTLYLIAAAMALATGPAAAQENVAEPTVNAANETMTTDTNVAMDANLVAATPAANAVEPVPAPTETDLATRAAADEDDRGGIPWGLLGLVGLIGLLGRRRG
jgi:MYXO-CTERM domain-containing protein